VKSGVKTLRFSAFSLRKLFALNQLIKTITKHTDRQTDRQRDIRKLLKQIKHK